MMIATVSKLAGAAVTAALAGSSAHNMFQTYQVSKSSVQNSSLPNFDNVPSHTVVKELQSMKRQELLELFLASDAPETEKLVGEWDGNLLDNHSWIMVRTYL